LPTFAPALTTCTLDPAVTVSVSRGVLDVGLLTASATFSGYQAFGVVSNNIPLRTMTGGVEKDAIFLTGADVQLVAQAPLVLPSGQSQFFVPVAAQRLAPNSNGVGEGVLTVEAIPRQIAAQLAAVVPTGADPTTSLVLARMRPVGQRAGSDITGNWVEFPIEICKYCLAPPPQACPAMPIPKTQVLLGDVCNPVQDAAVTCCTQGGAVLCGAQVPSM
jgi:hypothetical protein